MLNNYVCSVFTKDGEPNIVTLEPNSTIKDILITEDMVKEKIRKLKPHSAKGPENITERLLITKKITKKHLSVLSALYTENP